MLKRYAMGTFDLDENGVHAALLSQREEPSAVDYIMLKRYVLGEFEL